MWIATRTTIASAFDAPIEASEFNSTLNETKLSLSGNGLIAVVGSDRSGTMGGVDVWESVRTSTGNTFPAMGRTHVMALETAGSDHDPTLSADGLRIYLAPADPAPQHLAVASRATTGDNFGMPSAITELNGTDGDADPSPTTDERIIVFSSSRPASFVNSNIWYATRASGTGTFSAPRIVPDINTDMPDGDPHLSADGCRIYFGRDIGACDWNLFVATAQ